MPFVEFNGRRLMFIHIPRTGGTSVEASLNRVGLLHLKAMGISTGLRVTPQHFRSVDVEQLFADGFFSDVFTVCRDPYRRLESEYRMRQEIEVAGFFEKARPFSVWLEEVVNACRSNREYLDNHIRPQVDFLGRNTRIFKLEDGLDVVTSYISDFFELDLAGKVEHFYATKQFPLVWGVSDLTLVNDFYRTDFECLGYEMKTSSMIAAPLRD